MTYHTQTLDHKGLWTPGSDHLSVKSAILSIGDKVGRVLSDDDQIVWMSAEAPRPAKPRDSQAMLTIFCALVGSQHSRDLSVSQVIDLAAETYDELERRA